MKIITLLFIFVIISSSLFAETKIVSLKGEVYIRHGVAEEWLRAAVGDVLKPDDSMKSGKKSTATVSVDDAKKIVIPELVIVDVSDLRQLNQDEFLLMLAMEQVRSVSVPGQEKAPVIPRTTTVHGSQKGITSSETITGEAGEMELNGTSVLFNNGYFGTFILKTKRVYRLYPSSEKNVESRLQVANAFEKMNLKNDALTEYRSLQQESLSAKQQSLVEEKVKLLRH